MKNTFYWEGKIQSVNRWHGARAIKRGSKWTAMIYETADFKKFKQSLAAVFYKGNKMEGYVDMQITVCMSKKADTGNIEKAIGDTLESCGIIDNDKYIRNISFIRHYHPISGSKNKYKDILIVELLHVSTEDHVFIEAEQTTDVLGTKL